MERCRLCSATVCGGSPDKTCSYHCITCSVHCGISRCDNVPCSERDFRSAARCRYHCEDKDHLHCAEYGCVGADTGHGCHHRKDSSSLGLPCQDCSAATCYPDSIYCPHHCNLAKCKHCIADRCASIRCYGSLFCRKHCEESHGHCVIRGCDNTTNGELCHYHESLTY